jgi:hypothetical protein
MEVHVLFKNDIKLGGSGTSTIVDVYSDKAKARLDKRRLHRTLGIKYGYSYTITSKIVKE